MSKQIKSLNIEVPEEVPLSDTEEAAIKALEKLAKTWPKTLMLFSWSGSLVVVRSRGGEVLASILRIPNDGGDPGNYIDEASGREFLSLE